MPPNIRISRGTMTRGWSALWARVLVVRRPQAQCWSRVPSGDVPALRETLVPGRSSLDPHAAHLFTSTLLVSGTALIE